MHHFPQWHAGGLTDTDKLVPVCDDRCHQLFHEGGWTLTSPHYGIIDIHTPNGQHHKRITANQVIANAHAPPTAA